MLVTDPAEGRTHEVTACGIKLLYPELWDQALYSNIAGEHTDQEHEGVRPCCQRCVRIQKAEWAEEA